MDVVRERLANQFLTTRGPARATAVVRALGAVQAQDYAGAKWALSQRARDATDAEIERELTAGRILRTHVLRPTWHFVAADDLRWMLALTAPRVTAMTASYSRQLELSPAVYRRTNAAIAKALRGGTQLTRAELRPTIEALNIGPVNGQRLGHIMGQAELDGIVCSGAVRGKQFTYALLDDRAPPCQPRDRDESLLDLTLRYFGTRGPATLRDFSWWSGLTIADGKRGVDIAGKRLESVKIGGQSTWWSPRDRLAPRASGTAHLLPNYDEYFIGLKDRSAIGRRVGDTKLATGGDALITNIIFVDGQIVGGWKRTFDRKGAIVTLKLLVRLTAAERRRVAAQVDRFGAFLGKEVELNES